MKIDGGDQWRGSPRRSVSLAGARGPRTGGFGPRRQGSRSRAEPGRGGPGPRGGPRQSQETTTAGRRGKLPPGPDRVGRGEYIVRPSLIRLRDQFPFNSNQLRARQLLRRARSLARRVANTHRRGQRAATDTPSSPSPTASHVIFRLHLRYM